MAETLQNHHDDFARLRPYAGIIARPWRISQLQSAQLLQYFDTYVALQTASESDIGLHRQAHGAVAAQIESQRRTDGEWDRFAWQADIMAGFCRQMIGEIAQRTQD